MQNNRRESGPVLLHLIIRCPLGALAVVPLLFITGSTIVAQIRLNASVQTTQVISGEKEIALTVTVTNDKGGYVAGLKKESFTVLVNKTPQEISHLACVDVPLSIGILIDSSGSMTNASNKRLGAKRLNTIRDGLAHFMSLSNKENEYFLLGFAKQPELLVDNTREGNVISDRISSLELKGPTALYDACYMGVEKVARGAHGKRAIILVSDGVDNISTRREKELERLLQETDVLVYCITVSGIHENPFQTGQEYLALTMGNPILAKLARGTGGLAFFPSEATQIKSVFEMIAIDLQNQYTVVIRPTLSKKKDKWQSLKMKVTTPAGSSAEFRRLTVRSREGFYPSAGLR